VHIKELEQRAIRAGREVHKSAAICRHLFIAMRFSKATTFEPGQVFSFGKRVLLCSACRLLANVKMKKG